MARISACAGFDAPDGSHVHFQAWAKDGYPDAMADLRRQTSMGLRESMAAAGYQVPMAEDEFLRMVEPLCATSTEPDSEDG